MDNATIFAQERKQDKRKSSNGQTACNAATTSNTTSKDQQQAPASPPLIVVSQFRSADVLLGRGTGPANHMGNVYFRDLVEKMKPSYVETPSRKVKNRLVKDIVSDIKANGGRFLRKLNRTYSSVAEDDDELDGKKKEEGAVPAHPAPLPPVTFPIIDGSREQDEEHDKGALYAVVSDCVAFEKTKQAIRYVHYKKEPQQEHDRVAEVLRGEGNGGTAHDNNTMLSETTRTGGDDAILIIRDKRISSTRSPFTTSNREGKWVTACVGTDKSREPMRLETQLNQSTTRTMLEDKNGRSMNETEEWGGGAAAPVASPATIDVRPTKRPRRNSTDKGSFNEERQASFNFLASNGENHRHIGSTVNSIWRREIAGVGEGGNTILAALLGSGASLEMSSSRQEQSIVANILGLSPPAISSFLSAVPISATTSPYTRTEDKQEESNEDKWRTRQLLSILTTRGGIQQHLTDSLLRQFKTVPPPPLSSLACSPFISNRQDLFERFLAGEGASASTASTNSDMIRLSILYHHLLGGGLSSASAPALPSPSLLLTALLLQQQDQSYSARADARALNADTLHYSSALLHELLGGRGQILAPATPSAGIDRAFSGGAIEHRIHSSSVASTGSWNAAEDASKTFERNNKNENPRSEENIFS